MTQVNIHVTMLGEFTLGTGKQTLHSSESRSRKSWLLLAYLIYNHGRAVPQEELIEKLWGSEESSVNPANALKTMFHRLRYLLGRLDGLGGCELLLHQRGAYFWNNRVPLTLDVEEFVQLCRKAREAEKENRLALQLQAAQLYRGDFLTRYAAQPWVAETGLPFHRSYLEMAEGALPELEGSGRFSDAVALCRKAVAVEPDNEALHCRLMRELLELGDQAGAAAVYEEIRERLFARSGAMPSEALRKIYYEAMRNINENAVSICDLQGQLDENERCGGALYCDYDFFRVAYHARLRDLSRSGEIAHLCLITVDGAKGTHLSRRSLDSSMGNLREVICGSLRRGDMVTACSVSQYVLLLPRASYENSCRICERIAKAFYRRCPHSPARLYYTAQPLAADDDFLQ